LWALLSVTSAPSLAATGDGTLTDPNLQFVGRWDKSNSLAYVSNWGGAYVTTKFTGSRVAVKLSTPTTFKYVLDGQLGTYWAWGSNGTISLPVAQGSGPHTLQIAANWEDAKIPFQGVLLDPGEKTLPPDTRPTIEFIGDSITAGLQTTNGALSDYAWLTAEQLGAHHTQIAVSGITLVNGYHHPSGPWPGMEALYFKSRSAIDCKDVACADNPPWSFAEEQPRLVVINLGTNDGFLHVAGDVVQTHYIDFLRNVRARRPNAEIFVLRTFGDYYPTQTQAAVAARVAAGDSKVHFVDTKGWIATSDTADTIHPSDAGHRKITALLAPVLQPYLSASTSINDTQFTYDNPANWPYGTQAGAYQGDNHWSNVVNAVYKVPFTGTQVKVYGGRAPMHGIAAMWVDNDAVTNVDTYSPTRSDNVLLWSSPALPAGAHVLTVRVTGTKNAAATATYIAADRVEVVNGESNLLSNPGFEDGLAGWGVWPPGPWQYLDTTGSHSGTAHLTHRSTAPYAGTSYRFLTGLRDGLYTVKAWVRGSGGQVLYAKVLGGSSQVTLPASSTYTQIVLSNVNVTSGQLEIGFWSSDASGTGWLNVDDVSLSMQ
jgi:lysophospholipase L1-like esterase